MSLLCLIGVHRYTHARVTSVEPQYRRNKVVHIKTTHVYTCARCPHVKVVEHEQSVEFELPPFEHEYRG